MAFKFCKEESEKQMYKLQAAATDVLSFRSTQNEENEVCQNSKLSKSDFTPALKHIRIHSKALVISLTWNDFL